MILKATRTPRKQLCLTISKLPSLALANVISCLDDGNSLATGFPVIPRARKVSVNDSLWFLSTCSVPSQWLGMRQYRQLTKNQAHTEFKSWVWPSDKLLRLSVYLPIYKTGRMVTPVPASWVLSGAHEGMCENTLQGLTKSSWEWVNDGRSARRSPAKAVSTIPHIEVQVCCLQQPSDWSLLKATD